MNKIDGITISNSILNFVKEEVTKLPTPPRLGIIKIGDNPESNIYVSKKIEDASNVGIEVELIKSDSIDILNLQKVIHQMNDSENIDGFFIQLPLPLDVEYKHLLAEININKDVDGLSPMSLGAIWQNQINIGFLPATVMAVQACLEFVANDGDFDAEKFGSYRLHEFLSGKSIAIINHSFIVGKPLAGLLINQNATVTICHKFTRDISTITRNADIIITATGRPGLINAENVKFGSIIVDVGIKKTPNGVRGDADYDGLQDIASWITPVPNGVGPITRAMLLLNTLSAYKKSKTQNT